MPVFRIPAVLALCLTISLAGCYHAQVTTGKQPSAEVVEDTFANSWINGLVPPPPMSVAEACTNGVARVETRLSFVNMLVGGITFGIYTPMHIRVTCASGSGGQASRLVRPDEVDRVSRSDRDALRRALREAAWKATSTGAPAYVAVTE